MCSATTFSSYLIDFIERYNNSKLRDINKPTEQYQRLLFGDWEN